MEYTAIPTSVWNSMILQFPELEKLDSSIEFGELHFEQLSSSQKDKFLASKKNQTFEFINI